MFKNFNIQFSLVILRRYALSLWTTVFEFLDKMFILPKKLTFLPLTAKSESRMHVICTQFLGHSQILHNFPSFCTFSNSFQNKLEFDMKLRIQI
jgi:hypothetical protein